MEAVVVKAKGSTDAAEWLVASMIFYVQRGFMTPGELSVRTLTGKGSGNRGILDMWLFKRSVMLHVSGTVMDSLEFTAGTKARASGAFEDIHLTTAFDVNAHGQDGDGVLLPINRFMQAFSNNHAKADRVM
eukprot:11119162-Heterocapsa_arctica.AAC.1